MVLTADNYYSFRDEGEF
ncbi:MAG: hypothetical protein ACI35V_07880 [Sphingobacterium composti]